MNHTFDIGIVGRTIFILDSESPQIIPHTITGYNPENDRVKTKSLKDDNETHDFCLRVALNRDVFFDAELAVAAIIDLPLAVIDSVTSLLVSEDVSSNSKMFIKKMLHGRGL